MRNVPNNHSLTFINKGILFLTSFIIVAFGQPAWDHFLGLLAAVVGYAFFWRALITISSVKNRFWTSVGWFFAVQLVQLNWFISHPFLYIYGVYFFLAFGMALQFGVLGIFIQPARIKSLWGISFLAALWTIFEWSRLFLLSGFSFNPVGIALTGNIYSLQMASLVGVFGLSFWVMFINLLSLRYYLFKKSSLGWATLVLFPYIFGIFHINYHDRAHENKPQDSFKTLLVQTAFPVEEIENSPAFHDMVTYIMGEWHQILEIIKKHQGKPIDLIVLPEFVVPLGTYAMVYPFDQVVETFHEVLGKESLAYLPKAEWPIGTPENSRPDARLMVGNAFWVQALANYFNADVLAGLEDAEDLDNERQYYSAALLFHPQHLSKNEEFIFPERYEKRVLVPMGEYIPFEFCKKLAASYGVAGSFTCGKEAKIMDSRGVQISPSICYEETYGHLMSEGRNKGADLFVNLTSDVWYPNSKLPKQHFDHARSRSVENGIPLVRSCNTGITSAIDSLGRTIAVLGGDHPEKVEWVPDALYVDVPLYHYKTLYSFSGDYLIISCCFLMILIGFFTKNSYQ